MLRFGVLAPPPPVPVIGVEVLEGEVVTTAVPGPVVVVLVPGEVSVVGPGAGLVGAVTDGAAVRAAGAADLTAEEREAAELLEVELALKAGCEASTTVAPAMTKNTLKDVDMSQLRGNVFERTPLSRRRSAGTHDDAS